MEIPKSQHLPDSAEFITEHDAPLAKINAVKDQIDFVSAARSGKGRISQETLQLWRSQLQSALNQLV
jgi:hypothetical protein